MLRREYPAILGISVSFSTIHFCQIWIVERQVDHGVEWWGLAAAGTALFVVVRYLKRRTNLLTVPGR
jgi:hypothetical protein